MKHIHTLLMTSLLSTSALAADSVEPGTPVPEAPVCRAGLYTYLRRLSDTIRRRLCVPAR